MEGLKNIVIGYDGSTLSELAVRRALLMTQGSTLALLHVVMVVEECGSDDYRLPTGEVLPRYTALEMLRLTLRTQVQSWGLDSPRVRLVAHMRTGAVVRTLVDVSYRFRADLLVLGAHGDSRVAGSVGSVAREVLDWTRDLPVHVEASPFLGVKPQRFDGLDWAYVFGRTPLGSDSAGNEDRPPS